MQRRLFVASHVPPKTNNQCAPSPKIKIKIINIEGGSSITIDFFIIH